MPARILKTSAKFSRPALGSFISIVLISKLVVLLKDSIAGVFFRCFNWFISKSSKSAAEQKYSGNGNAILGTVKNVEDYVILISCVTDGEDNSSLESLPLKLRTKLKISNIKFLRLQYLIGESNLWKKNATNVTHIKCTLWYDTKTMRPKANRRIFFTKLFPIPFFS